MEPCRGNHTTACTLGPRSQGLFSQAQRPLSVGESGGRDVVVLLPVPLVGGFCLEEGLLCLKWWSWLWCGGVGVDVVGGGVGVKPPPFVCKW